MDLNLIKTFIKVAQLGSFTKAAQTLDQPKSRVSRAISKLEDEMMVQLVRRTTRQSALTHEGEKFYAATKDLIQELDYQVSNAASNEEVLQGDIMISAPEDMSTCLLPKLINEFQKLYPKVHMRVQITNQYVDLIKENIDIAFRIGKLKDSNLIQKKLRDVRLIMVASPDYLKFRERPKVLNDLKNHNFIPFHLYASKDEFKALDIKYNLISDSFQLSLSMALHSYGVTMLPDFFAQKYIDEGKLIHTLDIWQGDRSQMQIIYSPTKKIPLHIREFIDFASLMLKK